MRNLLSCAPFERICIMCIPQLISGEHYLPYYRNTRQFARTFHKLRYSIAMNRLRPRIVQTVAYYAMRRGSTYFLHKVAV